MSCKFESIVENHSCYVAPGGRNSGRELRSTWADESELLTHPYYLGMDINMVAGGGRHPLPQVLAQFALWASADDRLDTLSWDRAPTSLSKWAAYSILPHFRTTWQDKKDRNRWMAATCDKTFLPGPMKKHTTWQEYRDNKNALQY